MRLKIISCNLGNKTGLTSKQVRFLMERKPDILALQEVVPERLEELCVTLFKRGLEHSVNSLERVSARHGRTSRLGLLLVSRFPLKPVPMRWSSSNWPERILAGLIDIGGEPLLVVTAYVPPGSSNAWAKVDVLEGLYDVVFSLPRGPVIIAGDLNTPKAELPDGRVLTWAQRLDAHGSIRNVTSRNRKHSGRWDRAERSIIQGFPTLGFRDVFRSLHSYSSRESSWFLRRKTGSIGRRYDHIFASRELIGKSCEYLHSFRRSRLSDHSPIEAVFRLRTSG